MCSPLHISACSASASRDDDSLSWNLNTSSTIIARPIGTTVAGPCDTSRRSEYSESVSMSSLHECCRRFFHAGSSGAVSLSHVVSCAAVVAVVRMMIGRGSRIVCKDSVIQRNAASRWSLNPRERRCMENSWTSPWIKFCCSIGASAFSFSARLRAMPSCTPYFGGTRNKKCGQEQRTRKSRHSSSSDSMQTICLLKNIRLDFGGGRSPGFLAFGMHQYIPLLSLCSIRNLACGFLIALANDAALPDKTSSVGDVTVLLHLFDIGIGDVMVRRGCCSAERVKDWHHQADLRGEPREKAWSIGLIT
ncbi:hypothetical protein EDB89DRAFT_1964503 [Lactarius sanguifluus]|nr:hypothetical protein EDB89DRAFT_1964503 [Lactarius sanguifluus]